MAHSFLELDKAVAHGVHVIILIVFFFVCVCDCSFHSVCPLMDENQWLMEASRWERLSVGEN